MMIDFSKSSIDKKQFFGYVVFAYIFSIMIRLIWVYQFKDMGEFYWNGQLMINTNDGYFFASGVKNIIDNSLQYNLRVPGDEYGLVSFTYLLSKILPFSLDTIILYMPSVISSFVVVPIVLLGRLYNMTFLGFLSALLASITWSFYNRTMTGYYDTDLFALVFPVYIVYFLIKSIKKDSLVSLLIASLITCLYFYAYDAAKPVIFALALGYIGYLVVFYRNKENFLSFLILYSVASIDTFWYIRVILVVVLFLLFYKKAIKEKSVLWILAVVALITFFYLNNVFSLIYYKVYEYIETGVDKTSSLKFFQVHQTIREAGKIPFETFANRILGSQVSFVLGVVGYVLLVFRKREFLLFLPLVGIGFFAYIGGLRFTVYAIPAMAIGAVYLFYFVVDKLTKNNMVKNLTVVFATIVLLYPNIKHVINYKVPTVFNKQEVEVLDRLKHISSNEDYTLTWWDYGYPIWYYSDTNTLIDGGKHNHDNFIVSEILTTDSQQEVANLSRVAVENYVDIKDVVADSIFKNKDPQKFLDELKKRDFKLPKKTRDIYLYLPNRMLNIFPTVDLFSNLDLKTGSKKYNTFFYISRNFQENKNFLQLGQGIVLDKKESILRLGNSSVPLNSLIVTEYDKSGKLHIFKQSLHPNSHIYMIFMKNYHQILVLDSRMYNSAFIQMFVLENYDKELFEPVIMTPLAKVYKLKR